MPDKSVLDSDEPLPVMVWVYGGAFRVGGNGIPLYDGTNLVAHSIKRKKPVIVVVLNYRLNYFGFLASKELKEEIDNDPSLTGEQKAVGNWGLQDQKMAFLWVHDHIAAFHGNKNDITAFGESAGAISIAYHMMMPAHHGLFHRAIIQSGGVLTLPTQNIEHQCQKAFDALCTQLGIPKETPAAEKLARLRATPEKAISDVVDSDLTTMFSATVDGVLIDGAAQSWFSDASRLDPGVKKVLVGVNKDEGTLFSYSFNLKGDNWEVMRSRFGPDHEMDNFEKIYVRPAKGDSEAFVQVNTQILGDLLFHAPILTFASMVVEAPHVDASLYLFDCEVGTFEEKFRGIGAAHGFDLLYMFDSPPCRMLLSEQEAVMSKEVQNVWLEFATSSAKDIVPVVRQLWPASGEKNVIHFRRDLTVGRSDVHWIAKEKYDYWVRFFDYQLKRMAQGDFDSHGFKFGDNERN
ncbi:hypothetical protein DFQ27_001425 [Actinomortierella ambigua]|uniref:Carboxylesterase type B domain-containing protein n=1 Tax=Actinomortierella ambigua TaxID=1343610 RepID=A0A9P6QBD0_9FUNG|nr:hypothetical protein DFQ27_001425 [Actinomortierella ambigua]